MEETSEGATEERSLCQDGQTYNRCWQINKQGSNMWSFGAFRLVWLIGGLVTGCEFATGADAAPIKSCHRKTNTSKENDTRESVCCENRGAETGQSCCGQIAFNPAVATCCEVKDRNITTVCITQGISQCVSDCCGLKAYNPLNEMCCDSTIIVRPKPKAQCCGKVAFVEGELCCGPENNKKILKKNSKDDQCCGHELFNKTECCCATEDGGLKKEPRINSSCCPEESGHLRCGPENNKKILKKNSDDYQCCGHELFNNKTECCCATEDGGLKKEPRINSSCCPEESVAFVEEGHLRCGPENNKKILKKNSKDDQCCGHELFNKTECCCATEDGGLKKEPRINSSCCPEESGAKQQKPSSQPNCTEPQTHLCGSLCYNPNDFRCCERNQTEPHWCCAGQRDAVPTVCNPRTHICCDSCVSDGKPWTDQCCREAPHNFTQPGVLCCNNTLYKDIKQREECSEDGTPYNPVKGTICCSQFHGSPGQHCCGREDYQPDIEICCDGHRYLNREKIPLTCCGINAYNIKDPQMKCCAGKLYNLTSIGKQGHDEECCGTILHNSLSVCCSSGDKELLYSIKKDFSCCGHLYYNSSLWSCCAGKLSPVHHPGKHQNKTINKSGLLSLNNLNETDLCKEMHIGTVESVSSDSVVFRNVLKIHGRNGTVKPLAFLKIPYHCNSPKLIPGKTYFFHDVKFFAYFNRHSDPLYFIFSKCELSNFDQNPGDF